MHGLTPACSNMAGVVAASCFSPHFSCADCCWPLPPSLRTQKKTLHNSPVSSEPHLPPPPPRSPARSQSTCSECGLPAGRKCALCSACGGAFHPPCLQPPLQHRPPGSLPAALHGKNTWVCFHCECAIPVKVEEGQDDPAKMAAGGWSSGAFGRDPFQRRLREFWDREHAAAAAEHAKLLELRRQRREAREMAEKVCVSRDCQTFVCCVRVCVGDARIHTYAYVGWRVSVCVFFLWRARGWVPLGRAKRLVTVLFAGGENEIWRNLCTGG